MNASQLTMIKEAKRLLEDCSCFRGPEGPQGSTIVGPVGPQGPTGPSGSITDFTIPGASTNSLMYYTGSGFGAMSSLFYYSSINILSANLDIIPCIDNKYSLGSSNIYWKNIYASNYNGIENYNYISTNGLTSTVRGLGTVGYVSSTQLQSTVSGLGNIYISTNGLTSTVRGLGTVGYVSSTQLQSTVIGLGNIYISSFASNPVNSYGNVLRVDSVYGNDTIAPTQLYSYPFKTINGALSNASTGQTIWLMPGIYNESITLSKGVAIRGMNTQTVTIQKRDVTSNTTLIQMGENSRLEDVTMILTSQCNVNLIGIDFPSLISVDSKLRTAVLNVSSSGTGSQSTIGIYSGGTSITTYTTLNALRGCTVNVVSGGNGITRALYITNSNRFTARDVNFSARGISSVGIETTNVSSFAEIKTSSCFGDQYDINRKAGTIQLSATDLINATANGNSFSVNTEPSPIFFGVVGNIGNGTKCLVPGTVIYNELPTTFGLPFPQRLTIFQGLFTSGNALSAGDSAVYNLYKNSTSATPFMTATLNSANQTVRVQDKSESFNGIVDKLIVELTTSGGIGTKTDLFCALALY